VRETASPHWQTSSVALVDAMAAAETRIRQNYADSLEWLSELDSRGAARELGYASTAALLMHTLRITRTEARNRIAQAAELHTQTTPTGSVVEAALPHTAAALAEGKVSAEHVDVIRRTLKELPDLEHARRDQAEQVMLRQATEDEPRTLARFGARIRDLVDPDGPPPPHDDPVRPERELRRHIRRDGTMDFKGHLDAETAHLFEALLKPFDKSDPGVTEHRGYAERAGDALADVLKLAANCPDLPTHNGLRTEIAITVSMETLRDALDDTVLPGDIPLTAGEARRLACDAHVLPVVMGGTSKPLDVAVPAYVVPAHIRRALVLRDKGCVFPGCDRPAGATDAHHIVPWARRGPTQIDNLILLCPSHHRLLHTSTWTAALINDRAVFTPPAYVDPEQRPRSNALRGPPYDAAA
jgi:Domain of unknown function (DUF222)/HNH endonuclease